MFSRNPEVQRAQQEALVARFLFNCVYPQACEAASVEFSYPRPTRRFGWLLLFLAGSSWEISRLYMLNDAWRKHGGSWKLVVAWVLLYTMTKIDLGGVFERSNHILFLLREISIGVKVCVSSVLEIQVTLVAL